MPTSIESLIERQARYSRIRELASHSRFPGDPLSSVPPIITVSREFGALGAAVARRVAQRMEFALWDQELVHTIAERSGISDEWLATLDERRRGTLDEFLGDALMGPATTHYEYMRQLRRLVRTIAREGSAVIVGRGAPFIVGTEPCLRVRVICPVEKRIRGYAAREGINVQEAETIVRENDRARRAFVRQNFGRHVDHPWYYDLIVNTGTLSIEAAAQIIETTYHARFDKAARVISRDDRASRPSSESTATAESR